eukprot:COSAG01_NODE_30962_length_606_cov_1.112426_1_plen_116_part_10
MATGGSDQLAVTAGSGQLAVIDQAPSFEEIKDDITISSFFVKLTTQSAAGLPLWRCRGQCGPNGTGLTGPFSMARMRAHLLGIRRRGIAACTSLPRDIMFNNMCVPVERSQLTALV